MHRLIRLVVIAALAAPLPTLASGRPPGLVAIGGSLFLGPGQPGRQPSGRPSADAAYIRVVLDLSKMDRFRRLQDADPILGPNVEHPQVVRLPVPTPELVGEPEPPRRFGDPAFLPEELRVPGFDARAVVGVEEPRIVVGLRPPATEPDFQATCHIHDPGTGGHDHCFLVASYPLDPEVTVTARIPLTRPLQDLAPDRPAIVARLREAAACLDVTAAPPADPDAALAALLAANPSLTDCEGRLSS